MLGAILETLPERIALLRERTGDIERQASEQRHPPSLAAALGAGAYVSVIAEVKRRSPSRGEIRANLDAGAQAAAYERGGAAAVSVLTEPHRFGGSSDDLAAAVSSVSIPVLRKDFVVHQLQIIEARALGAAAVLLILRALAPAKLAELLACARDSSLDAVVEVRSEQELHRARDAGATIIGVNNRDLESLALDASTVERVLPRIPPGIVAIAESGVASVADVRLAASAGADAVLVGSSLSAATDVEEAVRRLAAVPRINRVS